MRSPALSTVTPSLEAGEVNHNQEANPMATLSGYTLDMELDRINRDMVEMLCDHLVAEHGYTMEQLVHSAHTHLGSEGLAQGKKVLDYLAPLDTCYPDQCDEDGNATPFLGTIEGRES